MGESKRRKATDLNYGKIPKVKPKRGLIVSPPIEIDGTSLHAKSSNLDPQELRFGLLFWDELVWPSSRAVYFASGPDEQFLEDAKILTRPDYTYNGDAAQGILRGQIQAFQDRELAEPGSWALSQGENSLLHKGGLIQEEEGALLELHRAIPVPARDVPLAEILEFRTRRADELLLLRTHLDSFIAEIQRAEDKPATLEKLIKEVDEACSDLLKVGKEWQFPVYLSNLKASFSLSPTKFLPAVMGGWKLAEPYGLTAASAVATASGVASTIEVKGDLGFRSVKRPVSPYRYAFHAQEELR